jgi:hypothetical protein
MIPVSIAYPCFRYGLFDGAIADEIYRAILPEIKMAAIKTDVALIVSLYVTYYGIKAEI